MRLHVHEWGASSAPTVVCLHGVTGHGRRFRKLAEEQLAQRFHVLAPDLRGHGRSGWNEPWTLETHLDDVLETLAEPAAWIGHSFGGRLTLELAARRPELVERAVLLDPAIYLPPDIAEQLAEGERQEKVFDSVEEAIEARSAGNSRTPRELLEEEMREHLVAGEDGRLRYRYSQPAVDRMYLELARRPPPPEAIQAPMLIVAGEESKVVGVGDVEPYRAALGDLLHVVVTPGGHVPLWDAFAETAAAVESFLS